MDCCNHNDHNENMEHHHGGHAHDMASEGAAADFLRRFWTVTVLLVPLIFLTETSLKLLGIPDFAARQYLQFGIASVIFYFSVVFFQHAKHEIMARQYGMMTLVSIAVSAGYLFSAASTFLPNLDAEFYIEISTLIWVLLFGHYLEARSSTAAGNALSEVAKLLPKGAHLIKGNDTEDIDIEMLKVNDVVLVKPGEKVPADGIIVASSANFNESLISGESKPVAKKSGDRVIAGAICIDGSVEVKLDRVGENSTIGQIKALVKEAQMTKPTAQGIADKAASVLTFSALTVSIITILVWSVLLGQPFTFALTLAITVLVIACPHALGLAIPTVSTIATTLAVKNGLFVKNLKKLEVVRKVDYVVFDKTGTLTEGNFTVTGGDDKLVAIAASLELHSSHVIGLSIVSYAKAKKLKLKKVMKFKNIAGKGVEGVINGKKYFVGKHGSASVAVLEGKKFLGEITLSDAIKKESQLAIEDIHRLGIKVAMLTGDSEEVAKEVSRKLNIDTYFSEVLPEDKYKHVKKLQEKGTVMMVGDGVNDAPALTQADVGVAIGAGTDVAVEAGDIVLTRSNPESVSALIKLSRKVYRKMQENLFWALGYNVLAIPAAAGLFIPLGFRLRPEIGALLMSMSSVIVVANALTLRRAKI